MSMKAIVKSVPSGDTLVLRNRPAGGQIPKERILHLADITSPRLGTVSRDDEPWAYEARDFLRSMAVGKEVTFTSIHSLPSNEEGVSRDLGYAQIAISGPPGTTTTPTMSDLSIEMLKNGWAKVKEIKREPTEEDNAKKAVEMEAKSQGKGLWNSHGPQARTVHYTMPADSQAFVTEWKGKPIDALVEQVRDGSTVRVRLLLEGEHQLANITLAGVKCPKAAVKPGDVSETFGEEAKFFTESRLLQRMVKVVILSLPSVTATPFQTTNSTTNSAPPPTTASVFIGTVLHPAGNVAEHLVAAGLARVVDWHAGMLASSGGMERLRAAERTAKEKKACLYAAPAGVGASANAKAGGVGSAASNRRSFEGVVTRVWSGDQISVAEKGEKERKLYLSSTRGPKMSDPKQAYYAHEAREFLRKKLIGKTVKVTIDFIRPKEGEFDERECATVRIGQQNANVAEQIIEKGLASVVRHKRDDEDRSPDYDKLMAAEQGAAAESRGIHSGKEVPSPKQPLNISETASRANQFINGFKRLGRIPAVVDFVPAGSRFKIFLPKDNQTLTLVLAGIKAPRTARNASEKGEPFGVEALEFSSRRYMQRDVEFEVLTVDKAGGFIGTLYLNKTENAALALVKEGLASIHEYSAEGLPWAKQLWEAEAQAKANKLNIWRNWDEDAVPENNADEAEDGNEETMKVEYQDVIVSDVRTTNGLGFSVQILNTEGIKSLDQLMRDFSVHYRGVGPSLPPGFVPKAGDLVSAKFSDGAWYRAKIRRASPVKKECELTFIDYGNQSTVPFSNIRPLDPKFQSLPGQAHDARLSFVKLPATNSEYYSDAVERFKELCQERKLIANIDFREGNVLHLRLMDPMMTEEMLNDPFACINNDLLREGLASVDRKGCQRYITGPKSGAIMKKMRESIDLAKRERLGMYEFGDIEEDE